MSDNWRTDEPEVGTVARLRVARNKIYVCGIFEEFTSEPKQWFDGYANYWPWKLSVIGKPVEWLPITTPEERRLRDLLRRALPYVAYEDMQVANHGGTCTDHAQFADEIRQAIGPLPGEGVE